MEYEGLLFLVIVLVVLAVAWVVKWQIFVFGGVILGKKCHWWRSSLIENLGQASCFHSKVVPYILGSQDFQLFGESPPIMWLTVFFSNEAGRTATFCKNHLIEMAWNENQIVFVFSWWFSLLRWLFAEDLFWWPQGTWLTLQGWMNSGFSRAGQESGGWKLKSLY